jgi:hypothetical protein
VSARSKREAARLNREAARLPRASARLVREPARCPRASARERRVAARVNFRYEISCPEGRPSPILRPYDAYRKEVRGREGALFDN